MTFSRFHAAVLATLLCCSGLSAADEALQKRLSERLRHVIPDAAITSVKPAPVTGLYEVMLGATVLYMSEDGRYVFRGDIFDLDSKANLTDTRRSEARTNAFGNLKAGSTIDFLAKSAKPLATLYVFTDIDCGYCRKFHQEVPALNKAGISVRYLAYPRTGIDSPSYDKAVAVWCATDRKSALTDAKSGKQPALTKCDNPVASDFRLGESMGVRGTPALFTEQGEELGGYIPAEELIRLFKAGG